ncbi:MAG: hypothetical protein ACREEM_15360 [Blastocatellia bacterium]
MMKLFEKKPSAVARRATALFVVMLFTLALSGAGVAGFPINLRQNKTYDVATAKRFVGVWKVKERPSDIAYKVLTFKMEGDRLAGTIRSTLVYYEPGTGVGRIAEEQDHSLQALTVEGATLTAKLTWKRGSGGEVQDLETRFRVALVSEDEIKVECTGEPNPYDGLVLKREK